jgi:hypothetical protein
MNVEIPFIGGSYTARSKNLNAQICQNLYVEVDQTGGRSVISLTGCPGMKPWLTPGVSGEVRSMKIDGGILYAVIGDSVYSITSGKIATLLGTLDTTSGWVDITSDGVYVAFFDSNGGWTWDGSDWAAIADVDLPSVSGASYQDGYYIVSRHLSDQIFITAADDPTSWDATDFATAEGSGDIMVSPISVERQLWLPGERSTEIWYNSGDTFPFTRNPGGFLDIGCGAKRSIAALMGQLMFLDNNNRVVRKNGLQLAPVSTYQIDYLISTFPKTSDAVAFMYYQDGHIFYEISFPTAGKTLCFDLSTEFWHTRASGEGDSRSRANCAERFTDKVLVGDYENGTIYEYDLDTFTDNGEPKRAIRASQTATNSQNFIFFNSFELEMETGVGDVVTDNPQIMLQISKDSGNTWSAERWRSMGQVGEYRKRVRWNRLGYGRNFIAKVIIADPVKRTFTRAYLDGTSTAASVK